MMQLNKMKSTLRLGKQQLVLILVNIFGFSNCLYPSFLYCIVFSGTNDWLRNQCIINSRRAVVGIKRGLRFTFKDIRFYRSEIIAKHRSGPICSTHAHLVWRLPGVQTFSLCVFKMTGISLCSTWCGST